MIAVPVLVAGLGRCGTSLVMQMLEAGGYPCFGEFPSYEPEELNYPGRSPLHLLGRSDAMKILDPFRDRSKWPNKFTARIIWLNRNVREQAKSQAKFCREVAELSVPPNAWRGMEKGLKSDKFLCVEWFNRCTSEPLFLSFEELIDSPFDCATSIERFLETALNRNEMANCVIKRDPKCRKDMSIEMALINGVEVGRRYETSTMMAARRLLNV